MRNDKLVALMAILAFGATSCLLPVRAAEKPPATDNPAAEHGAINRDASALSPKATISTEGKENFTERNPRLVVALSGGAFKVVAEIGVLRSLEQHHIKIDGIVGTSMGATIGALYCAGVPLDEIEALFVDNTIHKALLEGAISSELTRPIAPLAYIFKGRPYAGITAGNGYLHLLQQKLPATFEQLKIPFAAVATNLTDGQTAVLAKGNLPRAVLASSCIPSIYRPVMIDGKLYVDGGLKANLPSNIAQSMGADIVVAVVVDTAVTSVPNNLFKSKKQLIKRVMDIMMASTDKMQSTASDILIYPDVDFVPLITKDPEIMRRGIAAGQKAADSVAAQIANELVAVKQSPKAVTTQNVESSTEVTTK